MKGKLICDFLLYRYEKRKQEGKAERNRCCLKGSGGIWLFWSWYQQLPHTHRLSSSCRLHGFPCSQDSNNGSDSSSSKCLRRNQNVKCWWDQKGSILIPSKTFFLKKECVQLLALDSLIFTGISCTPTVRQALFSAHRDPHHLRSPCFVHPHASETVADILLCCFRVTGCSYSMCLPKTSAHI